ncbi:DNA modification methylase, partial [mine drainage metagenome]
MPARDRADPRNRLNDLTGKEWLQLSRSWWFQRGLGRNHPDTAIELQHPAPFSYLDVQKLIRLLTKPGMTVLDPFSGVGSTIKAAGLCGRNAIGIDVSSRWVKLGKKRVLHEVP